MSSMRDTAETESRSLLGQEIHTSSLDCALIVSACIWDHLPGGDLLYLPGMCRGWFDKGRWSFVIVQCALWHGLVEITTGRVLRVNTHQAFSLRAFSGRKIIRLS
jgi:hypothetical protein